jgi:hypothetical protein
MLVRLANDSEQMLKTLSKKIIAGKINGRD